MSNYKKSIKFEYNINYTVDKTLLLLVIWLQAIGEFLPELSGESAQELHSKRQCYILKIRYLKLYLIENVMILPVSDYLGAQAAHTFLHNHSHKYY